MVVPLNSLSELFKPNKFGQFLANVDGQFSFTFCMYLEILFAFCFLLIYSCSTPLNDMITQLVI
jgi:hypothetical protein